MNKEQFIRSKFRSLLSESLNEKVKDISEKLNLDKETKLYKDNEFDYVQEGECKECGSELYEGECKECGWKGDGDKEVMEKNERKLEKISDKEIEDLLGAPVLKGTVPSEFGETPNYTPKSVNSGNKRNNSPRR